MTFNIKCCFIVQTGFVAPDRAVKEAYFHYISVPAEANKPGHQSAAETTPALYHYDHLGRTFHDSFFRVLEGTCTGNAT